jgi:hypothetical protein
MTQYRIYYMADPHVRVRGFEAIEADDDGDAVSRAENQQRMLAVELWCANRFVKRWQLVCAGSASLVSRDQADAGEIEPRLERSK